MSHPDLPPTDPKTIIDHIRVRRKAVRIMLSEITMLSQRLRDTVGVTEWLKIMAEDAKTGLDDIAGVATGSARE